MDWQRLHKAIAYEADNNFADIQGNQYRFSEFITLSLGQAPQGLKGEQRRRWITFSRAFAGYQQLSTIQRRHLVVEAERFFDQVQKHLAGPPTEKVAETPKAGNYGQSYSLEAALSKIVGAAKAKELAKINLLSVGDLLYYYPRSHIDYSRQVPIARLQAGETVTIVGTVKRCNCFTSPKNSKLTILEIVLSDRSGQIKLSRFFAGNRYTNVPWQQQQKRRYAAGVILAASGLVKKNSYGVSLDNPELEVLATTGDTPDSLKIGRLLPVYALSEGVGADTVRQAVALVLPSVSRIHDPLPGEMTSQYGLVKLDRAIAQIHFPDDPESLEAARRRLIFDEFFYLQLGFLQRRRRAIATEISPALSPQGQLLTQFYNLLPFQLTAAQQRVIREILADLEKSTPMNRLVQGDVGAGKTIVAVAAILAALQSGCQAALMAPTEVLAEQHYRKIVGWFNLLHLPVELLTGSTKASKRRQIYSQVATGEVPLLVGTHALIQDQVNFHKLGLVVIDEQHRFGVGQRAKLQQKGQAPHVLTMTATPIPRTLALTIHGDLDVSQIDELPPGRQSIQTTALGNKERLQAYDLIRREVAQGRQAYIILPLVEDSEKLEAKSAIAEHQHLASQIFPSFRVGLLHGRLSSAEKDEVLNQFRDNQINILVSTTVIEVGVDVPNATVMLIENAERFGLSQLHQLRGRVGRGQHKSYCLLMNSSRVDTAKQRLQVLEQSQDGFFIAEMDLRLRGPGEVLGTRQSGVADFALASLVEDQDVLERSRQAAEDILSQDPELENLPGIKQELANRYQRLMGGAIFT